MDSVLSEEERNVLSLLATAWNAFLELPEEHPTERQEFMMHIHGAQRLVMARPTARSEQAFGAEEE